MNSSAKLCLRIYTITLYLYPVVFRERYADEMIEAARRLAATSHSTPRLGASFLWDMLKSLPRAHWHSAKTASPFANVAILLICIAPSVLIATLDQRTYRQNAYANPTFFAQQYRDATTAPTCATYAPGCTAWYARALAGGHPQEISSSSWLHSGLAFIAIYDSMGHALGSDGTLNGKWPQPPQSIFDTIRQRGEDRGTWQPQPGIRIAFVGRVLPSGGFVFSGDSLFESEAEQARSLRSTFSACLLPFILFFPGIAVRLLAWRRRRAAM